MSDLEKKHDDPEKKHGDPDALRPESGGFEEFGNTGGRFKSKKYKFL